MSQRIRHINDLMEVLRARQKETIDVLLKNIPDTEVIQALDPNQPHKEVLRSQIKFLAESTDMYRRLGMACLEAAAAARMVTESMEELEADL